MIHWDAFFPGRRKKDKPPKGFAFVPCRGDFHRSSEVFRVLGKCGSSPPTDKGDRPFSGRHARCING